MARPGRCVECEGMYDASDYDGSGLCPPCSKSLRDSGVNPVEWVKNKKPVPPPKAARDTK